MAPFTPNNNQSPVPPKPTGPAFTPVNKSIPGPSGKGITTGTVEVGGTHLGGSIGSSTTLTPEQNAANLRATTGLMSTPTNQQQVKNQLSNAELQAAQQRAESDQQRPVLMNPEQISNFSQLSPNALSNLGYKVNYDNQGNAQSVSYIPKPNAAQQQINQQIQSGQYVPQEAKQVPQSIVPFSAAPQQTTSTFNPFDFLFGESGKQFVGIGLPGQNLVTAQQIKTWIQDNSVSISKIISSSPANGFKPSSGQVYTKSFVIRTGAEFIPTTPGDVALYGAGYGISKAPVLVRVGAGAVTSVLGIKGALNSDLTPEQRVAAGLIGTAGASGVVFETIPYARGIKNLISPEYKPVVTAPEGFSVVDVNKPNYEQVGLIPKGYPSKTGETITVELPQNSPLVRGGFHVQQSEKVLFIGPEQKLATSQIGLFQEGTTIPIQREFYVSPPEPYLKIYETRVSRLGLNEGILNIPKQTEVGFGIPGKPQIGLTIAGVGRVEGFNTFAIGKGTELEAIKTSGTITNIKKLGVTNINGQGVDIYSYDITKGAGRFKSPSTVGSSTGATKVSGETILGVSQTRIQYKSVSTPTTSRTSSVLSPSFTTLTSSTTSITKSISFPSTRLSSPSTSITFIPSASSIPKSPKTTPPKTPTSPLISKNYRISTPKNPPSIPTIPRSSPVFSPKTYKIKTGSSKPTKSFFSGFSVFVRRRGKFSTVGTGLTEQQAFNLGTNITQNDLSQTFAVRGPQGQSPFAQPKGYYSKQSKKNGLVFIEGSKSKINTASEKGLLAFARMMKGGNKKRR